VPETGRLVHDFADTTWNTRFLGDLYQDLSEQARKRYALLQTPEFVEEFILDRTLEPALAEFGLSEVRLIDPTCGSGHFLLGAFRCLLERWFRTEPGTVERELVQRALNAVYGVNMNPYAVAIARLYAFRG
jgi:type I restriction-modification system DNA methylase subunit